MNILGVIQARGGSKGIPKKNIYEINGHPLISYSIAAGLKSKYITDLIVSTDDDNIAQIALNYGAKVPFMRPPELAGDIVPSIDSLKHALIETEKILNKKYEYIIELPCISPLRDEYDIDASLEKLMDTGCTSVISMVCTGEKHPTRLKKIIDDKIFDISSDYPEPLIGSRRQDLFPISYIRNGAIYSMTRDTIINSNNRQGCDSRPYIMSPEKSINIDTYFDLEMAELLIKNGKCTNKPKKNFKLLITTPLHFLKELLEKYEEIAYCTVVDPNSSKKDIMELLQNVDGWICHPCPKYKINEEILINSNLKFIASASTGTNHIDLKYCNKKNIKVLSIKSSSNVSKIKASSEFTFGLMLSTVRKIPQAFNNIKLGKWREDENNFRSIELFNKTLGIIGCGRIGFNNAQYGLAFGMKIMAYDPKIIIKDQRINQTNNITEVLENSDIIMICVHLSNETKNMVNDSWFSSMKNGVCFINTSRGEVIDEIALIKYLKSGKISAAGLDVLSNEADINESNPLISYARQNDNLIITPHIAGLTYDSERKAQEIIFEQIKEIL